MQDALLEMKGINKSFRGVQVLYDVHLDLGSEVLGLVGKNGAGKSTLMKILCGVEKADSGTIRFHGEEQASARAAGARRRNIAMIFQEFSLIPTLTVAENIVLSNLPRNALGLVDKAKCRTAARATLAALHVDINPDAKVRSLSVAEKQSVEIAKAVSEKKSVLIMDEPTAALSSDQISSLFALIRELKAQGISIIYISHNLRELFQVCDRVMVLRDGRNVSALKTADTDIQSVIAAITGTDVLAQEQRIRRTIGTLGARPRGDADSQPLLRVEDLCYADRLKNISFSVHPGEVLGIAGLTGSGRTELLECLFGIVRASSGRIFFRGKLWGEVSPKKAMRLGLFLIPDERQVKGLVLEHSVRHNATLSILDRLKTWIFLSNRKGTASAVSLSRRLNIVARSVEQKVGSLSGGNQQKVVISKAIAADSRVLLLDDPTIGVDVESKQEIAAFVRSYVESGDRAAVFVSSELEMVAEICDRVLLLRAGRIVNELTRSGGEDITESRLLSLV
jgi:ribose transport system ATP-binding protein